MNLIQTELQNAETMMLKVIPGTSLVEISPDNVAKVEAMIQNDSAYLKASDKSAGPNGYYGGSTAYWMTQLKKLLVDEASVEENEFHAVFSGVVEAVDRENSTHLNADGVGREEILKRIMAVDRKWLVECLKKPEETGLWQINYISEPTHPTGKSPNGNPYKARANISFASKFCHYACFYLFEGYEEQDNYSIFDNVLRRVLPKYISFYDLKNRKLDDYAEYRKAVDDILDHAEKRISRNGFDHLIWYYFKGRI